MGRLFPALVLALCLVPGRAGAAAIQPLAGIEKAVRDHVGKALGDANDLEVSVGRLDPRLRLARCEGPLQTRDTQARRDLRPSAVEVRCEGARPWALYVPVTVARYAEVVVAARPIARGTALVAADVTLARQRVGAVNADYYTDPAQVLGQVPLRPLVAGQLVVQGGLKRPQLVRRGDRVVLTTAGGGISVSMRGEALEDGALGQRVRVKNLSSARLVEGEVSAQGVVTVRLGTLM